MKSMLYVCDDCKAVIAEDELCRTWEGAYPEEKVYSYSCPYCGSEWVEEYYGEYDE